MKEKIEVLNYIQALRKIEKFCVYQERCQKDVRSKLYEWRMNKDEVESIICDLITNQFINEERFAKAFVSGKFRIKKWGKNKIKSELRQKSISETCINIALQEINDSEYMAILEKLIIGKSFLLNKSNSYIFKNRLAEYAISKGYESNIVWEIIQNKVKL